MCDLALPTFVYETMYILQYILLTFFSNSLFLT